METGSVYKITNTANGKVYIGITCRPVEQRVREHFRNSKELLAKDACEFGLNAFSVVVLNDNIPIELLETLETYYIRYFNSLYPNGYNFITSDEETETQRLNRIQRTMQGLAAAKARGRRGGRPKKDPEAIELAIELHEKGELSGAEIEQATGVSRSLMYRTIRERKAIA